MILDSNRKIKNLKQIKKFLESDEGQKYLQSFLDSPVGKELLEDPNIKMFTDSILNKPENNGNNRQNSINTTTDAPDDDGYFSDEDYNQKQQKKKEQNLDEANGEQNQDFLESQDGLDFLKKFFNSEDGKQFNQEMYGVKDFDPNASAQGEFNTSTEFSDAANAAIDAEKAAQSEESMEMAMAML
ncbi:hypothetical protein [Piscirickettsia litoralis]|uniref:Uncharacterized protein n=1 Tax=Piscirickettsia litoralis TaxID=1891921 RepID=A0ABX3A033_9GAMM|nr:hypothetical protein [Piscirickettsia litoralis]ODN41061.1 hypothetical protein BGC07_18105 [Piscirickettsia litoralis]